MKLVLPSLILVSVLTLRLQRKKSQSQHWDYTKKSLGISLDIENTKEKVLVSVSTMKPWFKKFGLETPNLAAIVISACFKMDLLVTAPQCSAQCVLCMLNTVPFTFRCEASIFCEVLGALYLLAPNFWILCAFNTFYQVFRRKPLP